MIQVAGGDLETEISSLMNLKYNHEEGPTWCARLLPYSPTDPWTTPEFKSTFPNQYTLLLGVHHAANDGFSLYIIQSAVIKLLQDVLESVHIDDSQFGRLTDPNLTMQVEQSVREKLEEDPIALNNMLEEMSTLHKSSTPLLSEAFNDPVVTQPQIKTLRTIIDRPTMESFHNKCKAAGVSLSSGMNSVLDRSLVELVREAGVQRDLYRVTSRHTVSERRYFSENPFNELESVKMFNLEEFVTNPSIGALTALQKKDWASLAAYYHLEPRPTLTKTQLQKLVLEHLMEEEILDRNEVQEQFPLSSGDTEEARLSLERERVKLEILREQNKAKELSYISNGDKYVPRFDEGQPETFFSQFEENAAIHSWPPGTSAVLLSNVFTGEAQRAYAGLSVGESLDYATVKSTILREYKRVPACYHKIFRTSQKRANQTFVELYREKLAQCQRWVDSAQVEKNYQKLLDLIVYEEVKSCMPEQLQSYLEGLGIHDLEAAGPASDHYLLTYPHVNFRNKLPLNQSSLKVNPNSSRPREPAALSPLEGRPRFAPMSSSRAAPEVGKLNLILTHLLIHYTQLINSKVVVTMARLLRTITTPPCLLPYTIARNGGVVGGTSLARQTTTTGWCDFPSAIRPCFTSHLASPRRTCHSGTNRTVPPEKDVSCNNPVTWLFPASTIVKRLVFAGKYSVLNTVCSITINSIHPIPDYTFEEMLHHLVRKVPSLRTCFRQHQDKLWICELHKPKIDFQVAGGDLETEISSLMNLKYNHEEGPTWCARLLPYSPTDPWTTPEFKSTFPNQYTLLLGVHHAANDGFSLYIIQSAVIKLLQDVLESVHIDDSQFGRLTDPNLTMQVEQSVREKLEEDPIALNNMLEEMSTLHNSFTPLLSEAFNDPVVTQPQIKTLRTIIDRPTMESFHNKCKAAGVSLSSGMNSVLDRSLVELVREAGVQRDLYRVTSRHSVSERRYFSENPFNELGCFLGAMPHTMVGSHRDRQEFWQYAKLSGEQYQEELKQKLVYKDRILNPYSPDGGISPLTMKNEVLVAGFAG
ncbi:hypothetical protein Pcinc_002581 [Petrolisthes cinctipes]|uniref:Condensation domain-containing protein n=1 Tax=Petrolisthes cinctipes TaxID=88211 RepID=A0AAE1GJE5_PETCI|nr:hypothetical protein Pcinc_002581 [Petrolisthes cinctipes]